jgi:FAD dependent oxidoreductase
LTTTTTTTLTRASLFDVRAAQVRWTDELRPKLRPIPTFDGPGVPLTSLSSDSQTLAAFSPPLLFPISFLTTTAMFASFRSLPRSLRFVALTGLGGGGAYYFFVPPNAPDPRDVTRRYKVPPPWTPPPREELLQKLRRSANTGDLQEELDFLVIGGGATSAGVALDAVTRGLKVTLVERHDFSSGAAFPSSLTPTPSMTFLIDGMQGRPPNRPNSSTEACGTSKRQ